jgi:uncharacterized membrane protein
VRRTAKHIAAVFGTSVLALILADLALVHGPILVRELLARDWLWLAIWLLVAGLTWAALFMCEFRPW